MLAALAFRHDHFETAVVFQIKDDTYHTGSLIEFREEFHRFFATEKVTLIWDGLPSHRSKAMTRWIADQRRWHIIERLPTYASEFNPFALVWGNAKSRELANLCPETIDDAGVVADAGLYRMGNDEQLCFNFLELIGLSL